jgi:hypothetical protein
MHTKGKITMKLSMRSVSLLAMSSLLSGSVFLTGCGTGEVNSSLPEEPVTVQLSGIVHGGTQGVSGATVQLWQTGSTGYGSAPTLLATTYSAIGSGSFTFPNPVTLSSVCATPPTGPFVYITAAGGDPTSHYGASSTVIPGIDNSGILLAAVVGCGAVSSSTSIFIDEVTTVATAYALGNFAKVTSVTEANGDTLPQLNIGTSSTNVQGLADAVANAQLLVNSQTGQANASSGTTLLPTAAVNTLANLIASCVNTTTNTSNACATIFPLAKQPVTGALQPANVFQALMNIAKFPGQNVPSLLSASTAYAPYGPAFAVTTANSTTAPNDLSLGIAYTNSTQATAAGNSAVGMTIDGNDNVWVIGASSGTTTSTANYISELSNANGTQTYTNTLGATGSPLDGSHTLRNARFDTSGNMWITDKNSTAGGVIKLIKSGQGVNIGSPTEYTFGISALDQNDYDLAVDASGNIWTASYGAQGNCTVATSATECYYVEFPIAGSVPYTATDSFGSSVQPTPTVRGMAADAVSASSGKGNIWTANYGVFGGATTGGTSVEVLNPSTGALTTVTVGSAADSPFGIALDASGGAYVDTVATTATSALYYVAQSTGSGGTTGTGAATPTVNATVANSVSVTGNGSSGALVNIPNASSSPANTASTVLPSGGLNEPGYIALDGAGNVFIANYNYGTTVEYSPTLNGYVSPYYGFSPSLTIPASTITVTAVTLAAAGTANIYYTGDTVVNGQQVTFSGFPAGGAYNFLNGNTYTVSSTSFNYFTIPDGGQAAVPKTTVAGTGTFAATNQALFECLPYVTTSTTTVCTTVGNGASRNNTVGVDRAGTVWTLGTNGTLVGMIGTAAPTNPVLAAGQSGQLP